MARPKSRCDAVFALIEYMGRNCVPNMLHNSLKMEKYEEKLTRNTKPISIDTYILHTECS